jgi:hypothetical protein
MFGTFIFSATLDMFCRTLLTFSADQMDQIELLGGLAIFGLSGFGFHGKMA